MVGAPPAVLAAAARRPPGDHPGRLRRPGAARLGRPVERRPGLHPRAAAHRGAAAARGGARRRRRAGAGPHRRAAARGPRPARRARRAPSWTGWPTTAGCPPATAAALPAALRRRVLRGWLRAGGVPDLQAVHLAAVDALLTALAGAGPGRPTGRRGRRPDVWQAGPAAPGRPGSDAASARSSRSLIRDRACDHLRSAGSRPRLRPGHRPRAAQRGADPGQDRRAGRADRHRLRRQGGPAGRRPQGRGAVHERLRPGAAAADADGVHGRLLLRLGHQLLRRRPHPQGPRPRHHRQARAGARGHHRLRADAVLAAEEPGRPRRRRRSRCARCCASPTRSRSRSR